MFPLFETLMLKDGVLQNIELHNQRANLSRKILFGTREFLNFEEIISISNEYKRGIYKYRVNYGKTELNVVISTYNKRVIHSLKLIVHNTISYDHKYNDRNCLNSLFEKREQADEILIVKNGMITDTSYSNIIFYDGTTWVTPETPLLKGTMRSYLLNKGTIVQQKIKMVELQQFVKARLINAMLPFDAEMDIDIKNITF